MLSRVLTVPALVIALSGTCAGTAGAQTDTGVYGPAAPENAGFVRVLHADPTRETLELPVGPRRFGPLSFGEVSPYRAFSAGISLLRSGGAQAELIVRPDSYTTVIVAAGRISTVADTRHADPARAQIVLYNAAGGAPADLLVAPDGPPVFEGVAAGESAARAVNAVPVDLAVRRGNSQVAGIDELRLTRGDSFGIFLLDGADDAVVRVHRAEVVIDE